MLTKDISNIIYFVQAKGINPAEPSCALAARLAEAESITKTNLLVYDFELNKLFFANERASSFLGVEKMTHNNQDDSFIENILHPVSYQLLQLNPRLRQRQTEDLCGVFYLKTQGKGKYGWVYATAKVINYNAAGVPKLIYICFLEVERAVEYYLKFIRNASTTGEETRVVELMGTLKDREMEMLSLIADECTSKEIADKLSITQAAVDAARKRLIKKLKVKSVVGLVKVAVALGLTGKGSLHTPYARNLGRHRRTVSNNFKVPANRTPDA